MPRTLGNSSLAAILDHTRFLCLQYCVRFVRAADKGEHDTLELYTRTVHLALRKGR